MHGSIQCPYQNAERVEESTMFWAAVSGDDDDHYCNVIERLMSASHTCHVLDRFFSAASIEQIKRFARLLIMTKLFDDIEYVHFMMASLARHGREHVAMYLVDHEWKDYRSMLSNELLKYSGWTCDRSHRSGDHLCNHATTINCDTSRKAMMTKKRRVAYLTSLNEIKRAELYR